jgi:demethoxyubiquinone hydroxylase (CLK1/Coq7/Cat5 family)
VSDAGDRGVRAALVRVLQDAHAGELAAAYAYRGHWKSLRRAKRAAERAEVHRMKRVVGWGPP